MNGNEVGNEVEAGAEPGKENPRKGDFVPQESSGLKSLEKAYSSPDVSLSMLIVGAVIVAALAGILVALVLFAG